MFKSRSLLVAVFAVAWLLVAALPSFAQFDTATVVGTVKDNTGGVVPGATVTLTNLDTGVTTVRVTEANGSFEFMTVRIGRYKVTAELQGFATAVADNVQVNVGARQRVDLQLSPGQVAETVEVVAATTLLETDSSQRAPADHRQAGRGAAAERPRVLGAGAAQPRRPAVGVEHRKRRHQP